MRNRQRAGRVCAAGILALSGARAWRSGVDAAGACAPPEAAGVGAPTSRG